MGIPNDMDNSHMLSIIEQKMCPDDRKVWSRDLEREAKSATLNNLINWMTIEMKSRMRATAPVRSGSNRRQVNTVYGEAEVGGKIRHKCWFCSNSNHWPDQCERFAAKSVDDRISAAKTNHACFSCLKKAGRDHRQANCSRRKQCTKVENGNQCTSTHHPLLHKSKTTHVGVASISDQKDTILPVITANICGSNGVYKPGNILFDSGAQITLIRRETADSLRLRGQDITVNIVKVGGEEEEIQTKVYKVSVTGMNKKYVVRAIGIPCISEEIKGVRSSALAEQFNLPREKIRRGNGHVDLLVGIDHAHMHTGQTRQVDHLVARESPLGWVIFGSTPGDLSNVTTTVLHVKTTSPVDLSDFWTTEGMGVQVDPCVCDANKLNQLDREEKRMIEQSARKVGDQWMIPYPWKRNPAELPDNKEQAVKRLESTECQLLKKPNKADAYNCKIIKMEEWPKEDSKPDAAKVERECIKKKTIGMVTTEAVELKNVIECKDYSSWKRLQRVTAWVLKFKNKLMAKIRRVREENSVAEESLTPNELEESRKVWINEAQKCLKDRLKRNEFRTLSPFEDEEGIIRVGGRVENALVSYETKHPALLPYDHRVSRLIAEEAHRMGHSGIATTAAKIRRRYWIIRVHDLVKTIKSNCVVCKETNPQVESQLMANLPPFRVAPHTPPFHYVSCDYFGPLTVKTSRNKTTKHYGVIFTCLNTRAVHLEIVTDCSAREFIQTLRRFFSIRGYPEMIMSDNGTQFVGALTDLKKMLQETGKKILQEYCVDKGVQWKFITPAAPHQNGTAEALVKSCKLALKKATGEHVLTPFELYTCLLEVANLVNQRPIGRPTNDPDDGAYLCPNDMLLGRASPEVPQGPFQETKNPRKRVEFVQKIVDSFWRRWTRDVFPLLVPRKKWNSERRNVRVNDVVVVQDGTAVRGKWRVGHVIEVYPGEDKKVRNMKVRTPSGEYSRPVQKIAVIHAAEGKEE